MKKRDIVKSSEEFNKILNNKQRVSNNRYIIFYYPSEDGKKYFGISAPKKYGNAVFRNKMKRRLRSLIDECNLLFKNGKKYILQEINSTVFKNVDGLMNNIEKVTNYLKEKIRLKKQN